VRIAIPSFVAALCLACSTFAATDSASTTRRHALCVADFRALGPSASLGPEAAGAIGARIVEAGRFQVVERTQMQSILKEQAFEQAACSGDECVVRMGQILGVDWMVSGDVGEVPGGFTINARLLDVGTGRILWQKHDVYLGDVRGFLMERLPRLADQMFEVKPERIVSDSLIDMLEGDVRKLPVSIVPEFAPQTVKLSIAKNSQVEELLPLQLHALDVGRADLVLVSQADTTVKRTIAVRVAPNLDNRARARRTRIRWLGTGGSFLVGLAGAVGGYLNNVELKKAQSDYDAARDAASVRSARNTLQQKELYRNLGYGAAVLGVAGIVGFQIAF
jgi:TolB-like protein